MKIRYRGSFDGKVASLPPAQPVEGAERVIEPGRPRELVRKTNIGAAILFAVLLVLVILRGGLGALHLGGVVLALLVVLPRELLRAVFYREECWFYLNFQDSMPFITGSEHMSRTRFLLLTLVPDLLFGLIPLVLFFIWPELKVLGTMGLICLPMGFGDYLLAWLVLRQVPSDAMVYRQYFHTYWY